MATTVKVKCPMCPTTIEYEHQESEAWGIVSIWDMGIVELTGHDRGKIREHLNTHTMEEVHAVQKRIADNYSARVARFSRDRR